LPDLHFPFHDNGQEVMELVSPETAPLQFLRVYLLRLGGKVCEHRFETGDREYVLDIFGGLCTVNISAKTGSATFPEIGERQNVFAGRPTMVYIPRDARVSIFAESESFEGVLISAPGEKGYSPVLVCPQEVQTRLVGKDNWQRTVHTAIGENIRANRLLVGETVNPPGNWSSAPPHKHDRYEDPEVPMEEVYLYKTNPAQGFGLQRVYTAPGDADPFDVTYAVHDDDTVVLPRGYHPVVAAPGYQLLYLWALAGEERKYGAWSDDPDHAWIKGAV
jgi:5-deoxy-glucuronate isomerase